MEQKTNVFLAAQPVEKLMGKYAAPCVISLLGAALGIVMKFLQIVISTVCVLATRKGRLENAVVPLRYLQYLFSKNTI